MKRLALILIGLLGLSFAPAAPAVDFNGDGTDDVVIFRPSVGLWAARGITRVYFGAWNDEPVPGDYNGDEADEIGIYRATSNLWALRGLSRIYYGSEGDIPVGGGADADWYRSGQDLCALAAGNIGIGTGNPAQNLHIKESGSIATIRLERGLGGETWDIGGTGIFLNFAYQGSNKVTLDTDGNVGIGTGGPDAKLTVQGTSGDYALVKVNQTGADTYGGLRIDRDGNEKWFVGVGDTNDDFLVRRSAGTNDLIISSSNGNVGIGTTPWGAPRLVVAGQILMEDYATFSFGPGYSGILSSSGELYAIDQGGNFTQLSPHDPETGEWIFYSKNVKTGRVVRVNMERMVRKIEELTGEKFMVEKWEKPVSPCSVPSPDGTCSTSSPE